MCTRRDDHRPRSDDGPALKGTRHLSLDNGAALERYDCGYRYFAPFIGGWLSPDPLGPVDGLNLYRFARNNPINRADPDGLESRRLWGRWQFAVSVSAPEGPPHVLRPSGRRPAATLRSEGPRPAVAELPTELEATRKVNDPKVGQKLKTWVESDVRPIGVNADGSTSFGSCRFRKLCIVGSGNSATLGVVAAEVGGVVLSEVSRSGRPVKT